jgi:hypothetical protein
MKQKKVLADLRSPVAPEKLMKLCHKGLERFPMVKFETI